MRIAEQYPNHQELLRAPRWRPACTSMPSISTTVWPSSSRPLLRKNATHNAQAEKNNPAFGRPSIITPRCAKLCPHSFELRPQTSGTSCFCGLQQGACHEKHRADRQWHSLSENRPEQCCKKIGKSRCPRTQQLRPRC